MGNLVSGEDFSDADVNPAAAGGLQIVAELPDAAQDSDPHLSDAGPSVGRLVSAATGSPWKVFADFIRSAIARV
jgi:hypothetical protein